MIREDEEVKMNDMEQDANNISKKAFERTTENIFYVFVFVWFIVTTFIAHNNKDIDIAFILLGMLMVLLLSVIIIFGIGLLTYKWFYRNNLGFQLAQEILKGYKERVKKGKAKIYLEVQLENSNKMEEMKEYIKNMRKKER